MGSGNRRTPCQTVRAGFRHTACRWSSEIGLRRIAHGSLQAIQSHGVEPIGGPTIKPEPPTLPTATPQPARQTPVYVIVDVVELVVRVPRRKVVAPTTQYRIERGNDFRHIARRIPGYRRQLVDAFPQPLHRTHRRPALHE